MKKRRYEEALDGLIMIFGNLGEDKTRKALRDPSDVNSKYIKDVRELSIKYFKHFFTHTEKRLRALNFFYKMFNYEEDLVPEAKQPDHIIHKTLEDEYWVAIARRDHVGAHRFGKMGGLLTREEYHKLVNLAADRNNSTDAHKYATEGELYDKENPEIKDLLEKLAVIDQNGADLKKEMAEERERMGMTDFKKYVPRDQELRKQRKEVLELLVSSIE